MGGVCLNLMREFQYEFRFSSLQFPRKKAESEVPVSCNAQLCLTKQNQCSVSSSGTCKEHRFKYNPAASNNTSLESFCQRTEIFNSRISLPGNTWASR